MATDTLTASQVAAMTGFSRSHVYRHYRAFGGFKVGDAVKYSRAVVETLIPRPNDNAPAGAVNTAGA